MYLLHRSVSVKCVDPPQVWHTALIWDQVHTDTETQSVGDRKHDDSTVTVWRTSQLAHPQHQAADWREGEIVQSSLQTCSWFYPECLGLHHTEPEPEPTASITHLISHNAPWRENVNMTLVNLRDQSQTPDCLNWSCCPEEVRGQTTSSHNQQPSFTLKTFEFQTEESVTWSKEMMSKTLCSH